MRKPPWQRIAVLAGLCALLVLMPTAPAHATITNVVPFNGAGEPIIGDAVFDNDELWAYVTSPSGGVVCVHKVTESPASCDDADSWGKTPVGPFYAGMTPVKAGKLPPGEWMHDRRRGKRRAGYGPQRAVHGRAVPDVHARVVHEEPELRGPVAEPAERDQVHVQRREGDERAVERA